MMKLVWLLLVLAVGFAAYVRFAPYDAARWHVAPTDDTVGDWTNHNAFRATRQITTSAPDVLKAFDTLVLKDANTTRMSGSPEEGLTTYQTRSALMGYPDYTTVGTVLADDGTQLVSIYGRARFGYSDVGQNGKRIKRWIAAMGPLLVTPSAQ